MYVNVLKAIIFDLDGTLLPMNEDEFTKGIFTLLCKNFQNTAMAHQQKME